MLRLIPNALTVLRLLLALPVGWLILDQQYGPALALGLIAGLTDAVDGWLARRLNAYSAFGAVLDPVADKVLMFVVFICLAMVGLIPWIVTLVVVTRDVIILAGATAYHGLIDELEVEPTALSKTNTFVQISYGVLVLVAALLAGFPSSALFAAALLVVAIGLVSGADYVINWSKRAMHRRDDSRAKRASGQD